jgi:membrane protein
VVVGAVRLVGRIRADRIQPRAAALAFHTLLAFIPLTAITFALMHFFDQAEGPREILTTFVSRYFPRATDEVIDAVTPLVEHIRLETVGLISFATLLPISIALVNQIELAMTDIFRTPRPKRMVRLLVYAALVLVAPFTAMLTVRYTPDIDIITLLDRYLGPFLASTLVLYLAFRFLPGSHTRNRAALAGAVVASVLLSLAKLGFGVYATEFAAGLHLAWGAVAFVPMLLIWVFVVWFLVLVGAELAAVTQELTEAPHPLPVGRVHRTLGWRRRHARHRARRRTR